MKIIIAILTFAQLAMASDKATSVVADIEKNLAPKNFKAVYAFTNYRTDGTVMNYETKFTVQDADHSHGYFMKPEREKGREMLRLKDVIWTYIPSVGKAVRVADRESFAGGDFSNADVLRVDWLNQYSPEMAKETANQYIIDLTAKGEAAYAKMRLWVDKKSGQPVQQQFYDSKGTLLKKLLYGPAKSFGKINRPARMVMENVITSQKSEMKILEMSFQNEALPASRFTVDNLGK